MKRQAIHIGISGGHQSSAAVALVDGRAVPCTLRQRMNLHTQLPEQVGRIVGGLLEALGERLAIKTDEIKRRIDTVGFSLPGYASQHDVVPARLAFEFAGWRHTPTLKLIDDTRAGLLGGRLAEVGVSAVANSGASVLAVSDWPSKKYFKFDGWGAIIGDLGSGFDTAQLLFQHLSRMRDEHIDPELFSPLRDHINEFQLRHSRPPIRELDDLHWWFDDLCRDFPTDWRYHFATCASVVTRAAQYALIPKEAAEVLRLAGSRLAATINTALAHYPELTETPVCCQGGMFEHSSIYMGAVAANLVSGATISAATYRPVVGALLVAQSTDDSLPPPTQIQAVLGAIDRLQGSDRAVAIPSYQSSPKGLLLQ